MPESGTYGSVRGAAGNSRPYRECLPLKDDGTRSGGRRPKTSKAGNRGPGSLGGATRYGESGVGRCVLVCTGDRVRMVRGAGACR